MSSIAVIGAGNLGRRHMESILNLAKPLKIFIVDPSDASIAAAKAAASAIEHIHSPRFLQKMEELPGELDFAVIATNSGTRREAVQLLLENRQVKYLLLEKVLFPSLKDYDAISGLLEKAQTKAWVNCGRRMQPLHRRLRDIFKGRENIFFSASGGNWGLCCNSIHLMDLIAYVTGSPKGFSLDTSQLDEGWFDSKRKGFIEMSGLLTGRSAACPHFSIFCSRNWTTPLLLTFEAEGLHAVTYEGAGILQIARAENNWQIETERFRIKYQSELTGPLFEELVATGECSLTAYGESILMHRPLIRAFLRHMNLEDNDLCMIT